MIRTCSRRGGYTLLEVLLASALAVILMAALYVALDVQLQLANVGRETVEQATVVRAVVNRIESDLSGCMGPVAPPLASATAAATTATDPSGAAAPAAATASDTIPFQAGVIGESEGGSPRLTIYVSRVAVQNAANAMTDGVAPADIRRVTYWMTERGLARQEIPWVTSENLQMSTEPDLSGKEPDEFVIAEEVTQITFRFWDGSEWQDTWDGRDLAADGVSLKGPPMAIQVQMSMTVAGKPNPVSVTHTISLLAGPGPATPDTSKSGM